jgi:hypothetical protein
MAELKIGFEYPAGLFAALKKNLDIKKGALLLPENESGVFAPWSITGFDRTTQRRMRIPPDRMYEALRLTESKTILTDLEQARGLAECFSSREAALAERILLCFFTSQDRITGALVLADSPYLFLEESLLRLLFTVVTETGSPLLAKTRDAPLRKRRDYGYVRKDRFLASLKKYARELPEGALLEFFTIDAQSLLAKIRESSPDIDEYRVLQDITAVIGTLLSGSPIFVSSKKKKILAVTRGGQFDCALLVHQVSLMIRNFFQAAGEAPDIEITKDTLPGGEIPGDVTSRFL